MSENKTGQTPEQPTDELDVEGHSMMLNPTIASDMARIRSREFEREARQRALVKEAKQAKR
jgi:hypothetical protein